MAVGKRETMSGRSRSWASAVSSSAPRSSPNLTGNPFARELRDRLAVCRPRKGRLHRLELRRVPLEALQLLPAPVERPRDERHDEVLGEPAEPLELQEGHLGLDHPELGQVAPGLRLLGPEGRTEAVDLAERRRRGLQIQLPRLREVGLVAEVVRLEERRGPLDGRAGQDRRIDPDVLPLVEEVGDPLLDLRPHAQDRMLLRGAHPEMPLPHQEIDAVLLGRDRVVLRGPQDLDSRGRHLEAARRPLVLPDRAGDAQRALLRRPLGGLPDLGRDVGPGHDRLDVPGAVAHDQELDLPRGALVEQPALDGRGLAVLLPDVPDRRCCHKGRGL